MDGDLGADGDLGVSSDLGINNPPLTIVSTCT